MQLLKHIWIVNPFDPLPNESDVPLRFWSLSKALAQEGYSVTWWSSDFSHLRKIKRLYCPDTDDFSIRLIKTPPYKKNISLSRINSHRVFSNNFYDEAIKKLKNKTLEKPFRIIVSLPPLGIAESAFKIKDYINGIIEKDTRNSQLNSENFCEVIVDIMDAWPEVFYRIFPEKIKHIIAPLLIYPFHRKARFAYQRADKISAVGQSYLEIAKKYLNTHKNFFLTIPFIKKNHQKQNLYKPMHLCYHGVDLKRFDSKIIRNRTFKYNKLIEQIKLFQPGHVKFKNKDKDKVYLQIVYMGALNSGYDLQTVVSVAEKWKNEGDMPLQIHFAGEGELSNGLKQRSKEFGLLEPFHRQNQKSKVIFHGQLKNVEMNSLLLSSDIALVTNRSNTLVACPYKAGEYAGAGLAMISCLDGEFNNLLSLWNAGLTYDSENIQSLYNAIKKYSKDFSLLRTHNINARKMAKHIFDREKTYKCFSKFIINNI